MSSQLDNKLIEIFHKYNGHSPEYFVDQVHKAFAEEALLEPDDIMLSINLYIEEYKLMTGQEWYERFERELEVSYLAIQTMIV